MPTPQPATVADNILAGINALCEAYAKAQIARIEAHYAATAEQHAHCKARGEYWDAAVSSQYQALLVTLQEALPDPVAVETFVPVRALPSGDVEVHGRDQNNRRVALHLTGAQAIAIGTHLSAYAAIGLDRAGVRINEYMPPVERTLPAAVTTPDPRTDADLETSQQQ